MAKQSYKIDLQCIKCESILPYINILAEESHIATWQGLCDNCYDGRSNDDNKLIRQLEIYSKNIKNIEKENFIQAGAKEKHSRYQLFIQNEILKWERHIVFNPTPIDDENQIFYLRLDLTKEDLEVYVI
jgi:hypothetical protein